MQRSNETLLLDTHVWIRLLSGEKKLAVATISAIDKGIAKSGVFVSAISIWEVAMLASRGRVTLSKPCKIWIEEALDPIGIRVVPLTPEIAIESCELPGGFHGDPADQLIVATARLINAALMTSDKKILAYGGGGNVRLYRE